jgi:hypothetical protein
MPIKEPEFTENDVALKEGESGPSVDRLIQFLHLRGYLPPNGEFKPSPDAAAAFTDKVKMALTLYQKDRSLPQSGEVDAATFASLTSRRCGRPDAPTAELNSTLRIEPHSVAGNPWQKQLITYRLTKPSDRPDLPVSMTEEALAQAFDIWHQALPALEFQKLDEGVAMIEIRFYGNEAQGGEDADSAFTAVTESNNGVLAVAFYPLHNLIGKRAGDIHVNDLVDWASPKADYDLVTVLAHEIGHALGFGHSDSLASLMYPDHTRTHAVLPAEDKTRLENVYVHNYTLVITSISDEKGGGRNPVGLHAVSAEELAEMEAGAASG